MNIQAKFKINESEITFNGTFEDYQLFLNSIPMKKVKITPPVIQCSREAALAHIQENKNQIQAIRFVKRTTGEVREMNFRLGVRKYLKGGDPAYSFADKGLIPVYDMQAPDKERGYRSIPVEGITDIVVKGNWVKVVD